MRTDSMRLSNTEGVQEQNALAPVSVLTPFSGLHEWDESSVAKKSADKQVVSRKVFALCKVTRKVLSSCNGTRNRGKNGFGRHVIPTAHA